jgi:hypothetical protein
VDAVIVQYQTTPDTAERNRELVEAVYAQLAERKPDGLRYATFRLADGVTFVHVAVVEGAENPLPALPAFQDFQQDMPNRAVRPPEPAPATLLGAYRFAGDTAAD